MLTLAEQSTRSVFNNRSDRYVENDKHQYELFDRYKCIASANEKMGHFSNNSDVFTYTELFWQRKRKVRFADELKQPLFHVREFESAHEETNTPCKSASAPIKGLSDTQIVFDESILKSCHVCVQAYGTVYTRNIYGTVAVKTDAKNVKNAFVRLTLDNWQTHEDVSCNFVQSEETFDRYLFYRALNGVKFDEVRASTEFAMCIECVDGKQFWDNNNTNNYKFT